MSTQTNTIRKALRRAANLPELNLNNYNDDDVASLNGSVIVLGVEAMDALAALSELEAQPSAPTVEKIMEVVEPIAYEAMLKARSWQFMPIIQHADIDDTLREPLHAALTKLLNP